MKLEQTYSKETGNEKPEGQIALDEWYKGYYKWLESKVVISNNLEKKFDDSDLAKLSRKLILLSLLPDMIEVISMDIKNYLDLNDMFRFEMRQKLNALINKSRTFVQHFGTFFSDAAEEQYGITSDLILDEFYRIFEI